MTAPGRRNRHSTEILSMLLEKADVQGYLTTEDLMEVYPNVSEDRERLEAILVALRRRGVDILDQEDEGSFDEMDDGLDDSPTIQTDLSRISTDDTIGLYLKEMSRVPLLSGEEELDLAKRIESGKGAKRDLNRSNGSTPAMRRAELETLINDGTLAREHLIKANTRLVVSIAKRYIGRGVPFLDLIQEGNLGLMKAVEKYEYQRGFRFSTYATWWIRQTITRSIADQGRTIRVPVHMVDRIRQLYRTTHEMEQKTGPRAHQRRTGRGHWACRSNKVDWMLRVSWLPLSLESPINDDEEDSELGMFVEDQVTPTPIQSAYTNLLREKVRRSAGNAAPARGAHPAPALWSGERAHLHPGRSGRRNLA